MMPITCPNCSRVESLEEVVTIGTEVRCPHCALRFVVGSTSGDPIDRGIEADPGYGAAAASVAARQKIASTRPDDHTPGDGLRPT